MIRVKLFAILTGMIATLATSAAPAFAEFESLTAKASGLYHSGAYTIEGGGATLDCTSTRGSWTILSGGSAATKGEDLRLTGSQWNGCLAKSSILKDLQAKIEDCNLEFEQKSGETKAKGSTLGACKIEVIVIGACIITIPAAKGLESNGLGISGQNLLVVAEDTGITTKPNATCLGVKETKEAKLKANFTAEGLKSV